MVEIKYKTKLNCYSTQWEYDGKIRGSQIFAKTPEEAEEIIKAKRETEKLSGQTIRQYILNPDELEEDFLKKRIAFLENETIIGFV